MRAPGITLRGRSRFALLLSTSLVAALPVLSGCDLDSISASPPAACSETGAQCQLGDGPLGVCERAPCAGGEAPPCFQCTPQH